MEKEPQNLSKKPLIAVSKGTYYWLLLHGKEEERHLVYIYTNEEGEEIVDSPFFDIEGKIFTIPMKRVKELYPSLLIKDLEAF